MLQVIAALRKHAPTGEEQLLDILNVIDSLLDSHHVDIVTAVMDVFLLYSKQGDPGYRLSVLKSFDKGMHVAIWLG